MAKKLLAALLAVMMVLGSLPVNMARADDIPSEIKQGDVITFGSYEQDNNLENGAEPIEWIVLSVDDDKALLLSKYLLDCRSFADEEDLKIQFPDGSGGIDSLNVKLTWETSSLRHWLNETFYDMAFNNDDKKFIIETELENPKNATYNIYGGNNTIDQVFLLTINDVVNIDYGFDADLLADAVLRKGIATAYVKSLDGWSEDNSKYNYWWLRTPGHCLKGAALVHEVGYVYESGGHYSSKHAVRPAMYLSLNAIQSSKGSQQEDENIVSSIFKGDVDRDGQITPKDVTKLRRYLAGGWDVKVDVADADVDSDGSITPKDVTLLRRYLAGGWGIELPNFFDSSVKLNKVSFPIASGWSEYQKSSVQNNNVYLVGYMTTDLSVYVYETVDVPEKDFEEATSSKTNFEKIGQIFIDEIVKQMETADTKVEIIDDGGVTYGKATGSGNAQGMNMSFAIYFKLQDNSFIVTMAMEMNSDVSVASDAIVFEVCKAAKKE